MKVHLFDIEENKKVPNWNYSRCIEGFKMAVCGYQREVVTTNISEVTCKICLKKIRGV